MYLFKLIYRYLQWDSLITPPQKNCIDVFIQNIIGYSHVKHRPFKTSLYTMFWVLLFHSVKEVIHWCDWQMYSGRVQHVVDHVKTLMSTDPDLHSWQIDLVTCLWSLQLHVKQGIALLKSNFIYGNTMHICIWFIKMKFE